ncbi:MAG: LacI family DNA-binding transcriptional regulator [Planctomycetota bacterium]
MPKPTAQAPAPASNGRPADAKPGKRVGIRDVARLAEVSVATVSMVLNHNPKITAATREKVRRVMEQTGYQPNRIAQSLSSKYTRMLAVILPTVRHVLADPYFGELISGICDRAERRGHKVVLEHAKPDWVRDRRHLELFDRRFVDGALCVGFNDHHGFLQDFGKNGWPMLSVNSEFPQWGIDHVVSDYAGGADQVMTYLFQLGHRKIGMVHGAFEIATARVVCEVFGQRVDEAGLGLDNTWLEDGLFTEVGGRDACERLLARHPDITAIFAGNDKMALGVMHQLALMGKRVPDDVSVVGYDDLQHAAFVNPALSTVHVPLYEVGVRAADRLIELIRKRTDSVSEVLPTHLKLRGSTAIAPR